ncbi:class I SAM-dependent methyltransferase [candidate division KSB1 bacterium]|nr:class I SAM-dependent methyltransferase [candidate division KSB1 bacterium]
MSFKDHFSTQATDYAQYRPNYPEALFAYLATLVPEHKLAWDCGTGNGQAALSLAPHFEKISATDPSAKQIANATPHAKINYHIAPAERTEIPPHSVDLITVAQALHWFDFEKFYAEVGRVLKPNGVLAVWCYTLLESEPQIDAILNEFYFDIVGRYWPPERKLLENNYRDIPFPFEQITTPRFYMEQEWRLDDLFGYLGTWSSVQRFIAQHGEDPREQIRARLREAWGEVAEPRRIKWPLHLKIGRLER